MKTVVIVLGAPIPTQQGPTNVVQHQRVTDVKIKDSWIIFTLDGGAEVGYNMNLVITYSVDPHGSVLKAPAIVAP